MSKVCDLVLTNDFIWSKYSKTVTDNIESLNINALYTYLLSLLINEMHVLDQWNLSWINVLTSLQMYK